MSPRCRPGRAAGFTISLPSAMAALNMARRGIGMFCTDWRVILSHAFCARRRRTAPRVASVSGVTPNAGRAWSQKAVR